jgi:hypothetical protein
MPRRHRLTGKQICGGKRKTNRNKPMNRFERPGGMEAQLRYLDSDFQVVVAGSFVRCAVTGQPIPLDELKYWSVARQEAYVDAETSLRRELQVHPELARK